MSRGAGLSRGRVVRLLLIVAVTWFVASLFVAPMLNPWVAWKISHDGESMMLMQRARIDMLLLREEAQGYWEREGEWPAEIAVPGVHDPAEALLVAELPAPFVLRLRFTDRFPASAGLAGTVLEHRLTPGTGSWRCRPGEPSPPSRWLAPDCQASAPWTIIEWLGLLLGITLVVLVALGLVWYRVQPAIAGIVRAPRRLFEQPLQALPALDRQLGWVRLRARVLADAGVATVRWREALRHAEAPATQQAAALAARIGAVDAPAAGWSLPGCVREWTLPDAMPLALERLWVYLPDNGLSGESIVQHVRGMPNGQDVVLVVSPSLAAEPALVAHADDPANLCVCLDQVAQSRWLLQPNAAVALLALLARQLKVTRISPYQTHGGITRPTAFFGRESLLARVLNREPGNYLLVGGRQLGKTSLMKAIERRFAGHPRVHCRYLSLRDHRLGVRLAVELGLPETADIDAVVAALSAQAGGRRLLLLVDETDLFLRADASAGYPQLAALRAISEEGRCHFMLAGFWDLYEAVTLDFASPLRNFGEVIHVGGLEEAACQALATEPMARLGVHFSAPELPRRLVAACGRRANLVAIVCQQLLAQLGRGERVIDATHLHAALVAEPVFDALAGWARLTPDAEANRIDRIVVYRVACAQLSGTGERSVGLDELLADFDGAGVRIDPEALRRALARLQLAYVIRREDDGPRFVFAVPLFATQFQGEEARTLHQRELQAMAGRVAERDAAGPAA
ncbi:hypothetical protein [Stenotrophomonas nematodicola]|uniref:ATP-binding protein n=1 Tax=Stenotrophomonas nematodicola TaxID=2656746 RepID=A0ABW7CXY8_9GAMM